MIAKVDPNVCTGCGLCVEICPVVFEIDGATAIVKVDVVPGQEEENCREAMESCPVEAISLKA